MKCPYCAHLGDKVVDSREGKEGEVIRRRRECLSCGRRFTSYERIDEIPFMVVKKDGTREPYDRNKVLGGLRKACEKRPVSRRAGEGGRRDRADGPGGPRKGDSDGEARRAGHGPPEGAGQGRLRPLRQRLPAGRGRRPVHE